MSKDTLAEGRTNIPLDAALTTAKEDYVAKRPNSKVAHIYTTEVLPGGNTGKI